MFFTRFLIVLCFLASSYANPLYMPEGMGLLDLDRHMRSGAIEINHLEPERIEPESTVTYRWDGERPDSYYEPKWMHDQNVFLPLATSLLRQIRSQTGHRIHSTADHEKYSTPEDLLSLLIEIAKPPSKSEVNKAAKSEERKPWTLNNDRETSRQAKDVQLASNAQRLPIELQIGILQQVPHVESLGKFYATLDTTDQLRETIWQEILLLSYFSQVDREVFRNLHRDPKYDKFLHAVVRSHSFDCQEAGSRAWSGGMTIVPISLSDELAKRIVPPKLSWLADYYQDYDRLLNEGHGELKERLDRFFFVNVMSPSVKSPSTLASKLTKLPTGWWLDSSQNLIEGGVSQLIKELIESVKSDYDKLVAALDVRRANYPRKDLPAYQLLTPELTPTFNLDGGESSILARLQAAQHLCKYSTTDFDQTFTTLIQEHTRVYGWLEALSARWSRVHDMEIVSFPRRFIHSTR